MHRLAGWGLHRIRRVIAELYGADPGGNVREWLRRGKKPRFRPRTFEKSLFYHEAYEMALKLRAEHPDWGYKKVASELNRKLPIRVPAMTVYYWVTGRSMPNVTPLRLSRSTLPYIAYCMGVGCGDYRRSDGGLHVKDREFIEHYAKAYGMATGVDIKTASDQSKEGFWTTYESGGWIRSALRTGLWRVFADLDPVSWLKGLYDSEGCVSPELSHRRRVLTRPMVKLTIGDSEVKELAKRKLKILGFSICESHSCGGERVVKGRRVKFGEYWSLYLRGWKQAEKFAGMIGFRVSYRREVLSDLLKLKSLPPKRRYRLWVQQYEKVGGRWRKRRSRLLA